MGRELEREQFPTSELTGSGKDERNKRKKRAESIGKAALFDVWLGFASLLVIYFLNVEWTLSAFPIRAPFTRERKQKVFSHV